MKNYTYHFEIKDLLTQFAAAFDDVVIKRYNKNRIPEQAISVRYVLAPKERVMYDIVNKAHNLTLPVIAMNVTSISRDNSRVFNKLDKLYNYKDERDSTAIKMPVPVNIEVSVSILSRYMQDMDQILSNFIPNSNPYFVISYKEPTAEQDTIEIRTDVNWGGTISMTSPTDLTFSDKFRIIADTTFTIKGWLFKNENTLTPPIITIHYNSTSVPNNFNFDVIYDTDIASYPAATNSTVANTSYKTLSGAPRITDLFLFTGGKYLRLPPGDMITGSISGMGDTYGPGGTYGRGSSFGTDYGPRGNYIDTVIQSRSSEGIYNHGSINLQKPGGYSSDKENLESGGNYLLGGNSFFHTETIVLSSSDRREFTALLLEDILYDVELSQYFLELTTNTNNITALNAFLEAPSSTLLTNLTSISSFYALVNTYNKYSDIDIFTPILSSINGAGSLLNLYSAPESNLFSGISSFATAYTPVDGYKLPIKRYTILTDGVILINIPLYSPSVFFDIVVINKGGWASTQSI